MSESRIEKSVSRIKPKLELLNTKYQLALSHNKIPYFIDEIKNWVNEAMSDEVEHEKTLLFADKACDIILALLEKKPDQLALATLTIKLDKLKKEMPSTNIGRICIGIITALLVPICAIFETLSFCGDAGQPDPWSGTKWLADKTWRMFHSPIHPAMKVIEDLSDSLQKSINQDIENEKLQKLKI